MMRLISTKSTKSTKNGKCDKKYRWGIVGTGRMANTFCKVLAQAENAEITRAILSGEKGVHRNAVLMNAGAALYIAGKADSMKDGVKLAAELIDSGKAAKTLEKFIAVSNRAEV